jgi:hypothetical protein
MAARSKASSKPSCDLPHLPEALALRRKIKVREAAALNAMHEDTFRKNFPETIIHLSDRLDVVELGTALNLQPKG